MENKAHALAAGAFVMAVAALLVALAWWLTREGGVRQSYELSSRDAVTGLNLQAAVRFKGVPVGKVTGISFDPKTPGNVLVRIAVNTSAPVTRSTYAMLGYQGVTGIAHVQLDDNGASTEPLVSTDGDLPRIPLRPSLVGRITDQGSQVLVQVEEASRRINRLLAPENQQALMGAIASAGEAALGFRQLSAELRALLAVPPGGTRTSVPELMQAAHGTLQTLQAASGEANQAVRRLNEKDGPVDKLAEGADALALGAGTLNASTLPRLHRMSDEATRAARRVGRVASSLGGNPQALLYGEGAVAPGPGETGFAPPVPAH